MKKIIFSLPIFFLLFSLFSYRSCQGREETTLYLGSLESSYNERGDLVSKKVALGAGTATIVRNTNYHTKETSISYLYPDHLSSTTLIDTYNDKGNQRTTLSYYPYGNTRETKDTKEDRLYTSQRKDFLSSLYFYNARYYNSTSSHFISADKAEGPNRYSYVGNNPVMRNDPTGMVISTGDQGGEDILAPKTNIINPNWFWYTSITQFGMQTRISRALSAEEPPWEYKSNINLNPKGIYIEPNYIDLNEKEDINYLINSLGDINLKSNDKKHNLEVINQALRDKYNRGGSIFYYSACMGGSMDAFVAAYELTKTPTIFLDVVSWNKHDKEEYAMANHSILGTIVDGQTYFIDNTMGNPKKVLMTPDEYAKYHLEKYDYVIHGYAVPHKGDPFNLMNKIQVSNLIPPLTFSSDPMNYWNNFILNP